MDVARLMLLFKSLREFYSQQAKEMSSQGNYVQPAIPRFDGHYDHWSMLMENFLRSKEYWHVVENGVETPKADVVLTETQQKELKGLSCVLRRVLLQLV
ncbi:hypothetical protein RJ641_024504 [Dillenia turbinata]|uniref:DUF4219 domain-containing protein n=1 Tax=Dillenia turbinata TaxID=194707 RepID=A0AAN8W831_9MAGN